MLARETITEATSELLELPLDESPEGPLRRILEAFKSVKEMYFYRSSTVTKYGLALSPFGAVSCISDWERTRRFMLGTYLAIREAQERFRGDVIRVVDGGAGPYALFGTTLATQFDEGEVEFIAIDYHKESTDCAREIVDVLGLRKMIPEIVRGDAVCYEADKPPHVCVSETMCRGLGETQVAVTANLASQLHEDGIWVPEEVQLRVGLEKFEDSLPGEKNRDLGLLFSLTKDFGRRLRTGAAVLFQEKFDLPAGLSIDNYKIMIQTIVRVSDVLCLPQNTGITGNLYGRGFMDGDEVVTMCRKLGALNVIEIKIENAISGPRSYDLRLGN